MKMRNLHFSRFLLACCLSFFLVSMPGIAGADTVAENTGGTSVGGNGFYGQSFTTTTLLPENNIAFNFFSDVMSTTPLAAGTGFLLSAVYFGTPAALSPATPGFLGMAPASGGFYTFSPALTLQPNTQYFLYQNGLALPGGTYGNVYAGGLAYFTSTSDTTYIPNIDGQSNNFRVTGTPVPETQASALFLFGALGFVALTAAKRLSAANLVSKSHLGTRSSGS